MTDRDLLLKKLGMIERCLSELRMFVKPEEIEVDVVKERFAEYTLQIAIQAALDAASHIISDQRLGEPATNRELLTTLVRFGWLPKDLEVGVTNMAGFRNLLVHGYADVDRAQVRRIVERDLVDLERFVVALRERLDREG